MSTLANQRGTSLVLYAALIAIVLAAVVTMRLTVQRAVQARIAAATVDMLQIPGDAGDGHVTQEFGAKAQDNLQGFLDQSDIVSTSNLSRTTVESAAYRDGAYRVDETVTDTRSGVEVSRELLPGVTRNAK